MPVEVHEMVEVEMRSSSMNGSAREWGDDDPKPYLVRMSGECDSQLGWLMTERRG